MLSSTLRSINLVRKLSFKTNVIDDFILEITSLVTKLTSAIVSITKFGDLFFKLLPIYFNCD